MGRAKKNSHGTFIDWCTGREWPLNCKTIISAWWQLNIRFQRSNGRRTSIYLSWVRRASWVASRVQVSWREDVVGKATPGRGGPREPRWSLGTWEVADKMQQITQQSEPLGLRLSIKRTRKTQRDGQNSGVKILQLCSISNSLSQWNPTQPFSNPYNKVRGKYC